MIDFTAQTGDVEPSEIIGLKAALVHVIEQSGYDGQQGSPEELTIALLPSLESFLKFGAPAAGESTSPWRPSTHVTVAYLTSVSEPESRAEYLAGISGVALLVWLLGLPFILRKRPISIRREAVATPLVLLLLPLLAGCVTVKPPTPGEPVKETLPRPVIVIGGIADGWRTATGPALYVREHTGEERILAVHPGFAWSFDGAADMVVDAVERYFPSDDPHQTVEVDVIGVSMGGLVARHAAAPGQNGARKRLNIRRLYTLAAPHSGAVLADMFGLFGTPQEMRSDGAFLRRLKQREQATADDDFEIVAYSRGRDQVIGEGLDLPAHLRGTQLHYSRLWYAPGHWGVHRDKRILADIVAQLGESGGDAAQLQARTEPD